MEHKWSLFYFPTHTQIDELTRYQIRMLLRALPESELRYWMVWIEEKQSWTSLGETLAQAEETTSAQSGSLAPAPPPHTEERMQEVSDADGVNAVDPGGSTDPHIKNRRLSTRFSKRFQVFAELGGKVVSNRTVDISASGMRLENGFTPKDAKPFSVTLVRDRDKATISMICEPTGKGPKYDSLKITKVAKKDLFYTWLSEEEK
jgi:hypothetical protein